MGIHTIERFSALFTEELLTVNHGQVVCVDQECRYVFIQLDHPVSRFQLVGVHQDAVYGLTWLPLFIPDSGIDCRRRHLFPIRTCNGISQLPANVRHSDIYPLLKID